MDYQHFLETKRNTLLGYWLFSVLVEQPYLLDTPSPPEGVSSDKLEEFRQRINDCMPLDSMIMELLNWDIQFQDELEIDWYYEAAFGSPESIGYCAEELAEFFLEKNHENDMGTTRMSRTSIWRN